MIGSDTLLLAASDLIWGVHPAIWKAINFVALVVLIAWVARRALAPALASRSLQIREEIESAEALHARVSERFQDYERRLADVDDRVEQVIHEARESAEAEGARLVEQARESAERMKNDARQIADQEIERARHALLTETMALATQAAEESLRTHLRAEDQQRLAEEFLEKVEASDS